MADNDTTATAFQLRFRAVVEERVADLAARQEIRAGALRRALKVVERHDGSADIYQVEPEFHLAKATKSGSQVWGLTKMRSELEKLIALFHRVERFLVAASDHQPLIA